MNYVCNYCKEEFATDVERFEHIKKYHNDEKTKNGTNDGGANSFYCIPDWVKDLDDLAEYLDLRGDEFNVLKSLWTNIGIRHSATNEVRESNKCLHYSKRRANRIARKAKSHA